MVFTHVFFQNHHITKKAKSEKKIKQTIKKIDLKQRFEHTLFLKVIIIAYAKVLIIKNTYKTLYLETKAQEKRCTIGPFNK